MSFVSGTWFAAVLGWNARVLRCETQRAEVLSAGGQTRGSTRRTGQAMQAGHLPLFEQGIDHLLFGAIGTGQQRSLGQSVHVRLRWSGRVEGSSSSVGTILPRIGVYWSELARAATNGGIARATFFAARGQAIMSGTWTKTVPISPPSGWRAFQNRRPSAGMSNDHGRFSPYRR